MSILITLLVRKILRRSLKNREFCKEMADKFSDSYFRNLFDIYKGTDRDLRDSGVFQNKYPKNFSSLRTVM
ncbi:hypothetical protein A2415_04905 [candidate division WWE3 bacterium RIFOXYC1_FULL_39_7]|uniref:Uncharacterized protein n=2 Tax=Katanobacteria TaxID=422282 RepID=A0A1F4X6S3_UNCKA|nr:MAG: hypothetical protein A2415_04905 [candidate division WWE3 bacterium RIFOXYC1_FULL_39_7]OGC77400.1 MAG: hypothetical protein A2619_03235 [candidate division WWE3 bacterium RIFOXYD1_FULL_39_9]